MNNDVFHVGIKPRLELMTNRYVDKLEWQSVELKQFCSIRVDSRQAFMLKRKHFSAVECTVSVECKEFTAETVLTVTEMQPGIVH